MSEDKVKLGLSAILAFMCSTSMIVSHGETRIGWFIIGMMLIWGM